MQVENEYGYYSSDTAYIDALREIMLDNGVTVPLITSDGPWDGALERGSTKGALPTATWARGFSGFIAKAMGAIEPFRDSRR